MQHEHAHWDEVGVTQVVNEAADVAIVAGIDTIHFPILERTECIQVITRESVTAVTFVFGLKSPGAWGVNTRQAKMMVQ